MSLLISGDLYLGSTGSNANNGILGWRNQLTPARVSATSQLADYPIQNIANPLTHSIWAAANLDPQVITVSLNPLTMTDYIGIARHNLGDTGMLVTIEGRTAQETDWSPLLMPFRVADNMPILARFVRQPLTQLRITITPTTVAPRIAVLYVGKLTLLERRIYVGHTPLNLGLDVSDSVGVSISGNYLGRIVRSERHSTGVSMANISPSWMRNEFEPFKKARVPFFFAWRPSDYPLEVGYCWFPQGHNPRPTNSRSNGMMGVDFEMQGLGGSSAIVLPEVTV